MSMPNHLVLVRHGESEGNVVNNLAKQGDESLYTPQFRETPGHRWRLTEKGRAQARATGKWILENIGDDFFRYYVSPYVRTRETAALLGLPNAQWRIDQRLRERDWGLVEGIPRREFEAEFERFARAKKTDSLYARLPGGESIADVRNNRVRSMFDTLHRECFGKHVIIVTHGEFMWGHRAEIEYMSDEEWVAADADKSQQIHNTQAHWYARINPATGEQSKYISWVRRVTPHMDLDTGWLPIRRHLFSNEQLLRQVNAVEPVIPPQPAES